MEEKIKDLQKQVIKLDDEVKVLKGKYNVLFVICIILASTVTVLFMR